MKYRKIEKSQRNTINSVRFGFVLQRSRHDSLAVHFIFELSLVLYRFSHLLFFDLCVLDLLLSRFPSIPPLSLVSHYEVLCRVSAYDLSRFVFILFSEVQTHLCLSSFPSILIFSIVLQLQMSTASPDTFSYFSFNGIYFAIIQRYTSYICFDQLFFSYSNLLMLIIFSSI